jgi:hypothetical protein
VEEAGVGQDHWRTILFLTTRAREKWLHGKRFAQGSWDFWVGVYQSGFNASAFFVQLEPTTGLKYQKGAMRNETAKEERASNEQ